MRECVVLAGALLWAAHCSAAQAGAAQVGAAQAVPGAPVTVAAKSVATAATPGPAVTAAPPPEAENAPADDAPIPIPPVPPRIANGDQYDRCMDMLADDPAGADALASAWHGGGEAATHCHALAQIELGNPASGAALLMSLAAASQSPPTARAEVFGQAAQAWTMAGDSRRALDAASQAVTLSPEDPDLRVTHAIAALAVHQDSAADEDLSDALDADPKRIDALVLRATARRHLGRLADAQADIDRALSQDSENADALLERGIIRERIGDLAGARADWERVEDLSPDTATGDLAQQNLALLDAGPRQ
jgi:tetratricopeptide (TPR) repeat protein